MKPLRLVDGKFYRGNEEVPICIGDREQIDLLKNIERAAEDADRYGVDVDFEVSDIRYEVGLSFQCSCGKLISERNDCNGDYGCVIEDEAAEDYYQEEKVRCQNCKTMYKIDGNKAIIIKS